MSDTACIPRSGPPSAKDTIRLPRMAKPATKETVRLDRLPSKSKPSPQPGASLEDYLQQQEPHGEPPPQ
jgi:hypothetical protein